MLNISWTDKADVDKKLRINTLIKKILILIWICYEIGEDKHIFES